MAKKKNWFEKTMAVLGGLCVAGGLVFSIMWFVPGIHDKVWPTQEITTEQEQDTTNNNVNTETDNTTEE